MDDDPIPEAPKPTKSLEEILGSLQSAFDPPLRQLQEGLESLRERRGGHAENSFQQNLDVMIQVCSDLRELARRGLDRPRANGRPVE